MYSGLNDPQRWVLPRVLAEQAGLRPDAPWIITTDGERWTFGEAHADVQTVAGHFAELGVQPGDRVVLPLERDLACVMYTSGTSGPAKGVLAAFVAGQPSSAHDGDHRLRAVLNGPNLPELEQVLRERFGVRDVISGFGMTEINMPVWGRLGRSLPGASGWVHADHFELIVADPLTDRALPVGEVGEILVRPKVPWGFMAGYQGMPQKTVEAWRNLWFHTGDAGRLDADGVLTFVDRLKDCIRRRGENIAAAEVENLVATLPGVAEVAAYAVPSDIPGGEDELMLSSVAGPGEPTGAEALVALAELGHAAEALLPRYARPRYLRWVAELPKTATGKVQRAMLRQAGSAGALDREDNARENARGDAKDGARTRGDAQ